MSQSHWAWPDIKGLHDFRGKLVHTASWDDSLDLTNKRVAVIGAGASAIQVVPTIQPGKFTIVTMNMKAKEPNRMRELVVKQLFSFHRSPSWIAMEFAGQWATEGRNTEYSEKQRRQFREDPEYFLEYRRNIESSMNARFPSFFRYSGAQKLGVENVSKSMRTRLGNDPELSKKLIPKFPLGCRRVTPGHGYLEALTKENVTVETTSISRVTDSGIETADGKLHEVDVIVTATGYVTSFVPRFPIIGLNGVNLQEVWRRKAAQGYLSVTVPSMPNYFSKSHHVLKLRHRLMLYNSNDRSQLSNQQWLAYSCD